MATYKVTDTELSNIADAIRAKGGTSELLVFPSGFVSAVSNITGISAADEGKVVSGGALVPQGSMSVISNGLYDTTLYSSVSVAIPDAVLMSKIISENGTYEASDDGAEGYSQVTVNVAGGGGDDNSLLIAIGLSEGSINNSVMAMVPAYAFYENKTITGIYGQNVSLVQSLAFSGCSSLLSVSFPECMSISINAFGYCKSLEVISLPKCNIIGNAAFSQCSRLDNVNLPKCSSIGNSAFLLCTSLTNVILPECSYIGSSAFNYCSNLKSVYLLAQSIALLANANAFYNTPIYSSTYLGEFGSIYVPSDLVDDYKSAANWSIYSDRITAHIEE